MVISQTPVRISLAGGGTDFPDFYKNHGGLIISSAINKYIYVVIKPRFDKDITVNYRSVAEHVNDINDISHDFIREAANLIGMTNGFDIITLSDVPTEGSGLGSSSALIVGLINAMSAYKEIYLTPEQLAKLACQLEIDILKKPIGEQDQYIAAYGGFRSFEFSKEGLERTLNLGKKMHPSFLNQIENNLFLHYIPSSRDSHAILTEQKNNIPNKETELLKILDISKQLFSNFLEYKITFRQISFAINDSWAIKKTLSSNISNEKIEEMIKKAEHSGATACKVAGAGGGGFLISYVPEESHNKFINIMNNLYDELIFKFEENGSRIIFNN